jgi:hypothetical protein
MNDMNDAEKTIYALPIIASDNKEIISLFSCILNALDKPFIPIKLLDGKISLNVANNAVRDEVKTWIINNYPLVIQEMKRMPTDPEINYFDF